MKHHAKYLMPGSFFSEETTRELENRSVEEAIDRMPPGTFAFRLYDTAEVDFEYDEELFRIIPKQQNASHLYYPDGETFTVEAIKAMNDDGKLDILISNAEGNGWDPLVRTRMGNWQPFEDGDEIVAVEDG